MQLCNFKLYYQQFLQYTFLGKQNSRAPSKRFLRKIPQKSIRWSPFFEFFSYKIGCSKSVNIDSSKDISNNFPNFPGVHSSQTTRWITKLDLVSFIYFCLTTTYFLLLVCILRWFLK